MSVCRNSPSLPLLQISIIKHTTENIVTILLLHLDKSYQPLLVTHLVGVVCFIMERVWGFEPQLRSLEGWRLTLSLPAFVNYTSKFKSCQVILRSNELFLLPVCRT